LTQQIISRKTFFLVWLALLFLLAATVIAALFDSGWISLAIALGIAICKALLIVTFFMHVRVSNRLVVIFATAGFFWLGIMVVLTMSDYISRGWVPGPLK